MNILVTQTVFRPILHKAAAGVDHKNALPSSGVFFVNYDDAGGNACAIKQICRQADDALDVALANQGAPDVAFGIATKEHAMRQNARAFAVALECADDVQ